MVEKAKTKIPLDKQTHIIRLLKLITQTDTEKSYKKRDFQKASSIDQNHQSKLLLSGLFPFLLPSVASLRGPMRQRRTEVHRFNPRVQQLHDGREVHASRCLVLIDRRTAGYSVVHELLECATLHNPNLERPDCFVRNSVLPVHRV